MVRVWISAGVMFALVGGAAIAQPAPFEEEAAQVLDWTRAGGDLLGRLETPGSEPVSTEPPAESPYGALIAEAAARYGIDARLFDALVQVESGYRPDAVSPAGAAGLAQLMPSTAAALGVVDRFDPEANLMGGAAYFAAQLRRFGDVRLALAAYNAGPGRVRDGRVPAIPETEAYVVSILDCFLARVAGRDVRRRADCRSAEATR